MFVAALSALLLGCGVGPPDAQAKALSPRFSVSFGVGYAHALIGVMAELTLGKFAIDAAIGATPTSLSFLDNDMFVEDTYGELFLHDDGPLNDGGSHAWSWPLLSIGGRWFVLGGPSGLVLGSHLLWGHTVHLDDSSGASVNTFNVLSLSTTIGWRFRAGGVLMDLGVGPALVFRTAERTGPPPYHEVETALAPAFDVEWALGYEF
jgi:hypothetical protein